MVGPESGRSPRLSLKRMNIFKSRPFWAAVFSLGLVGVLSLIGITYQNISRHRSFPWMLWLGGIEWFWCTWLAGKQLGKQRPPANGAPTETPGRNPRASTREP